MSSEIHICLTMKNIRGIQSNPTTNKGKKKEIAQQPGHLEQFKTTEKMFLVVIYGNS